MDQGRANGPASSTAQENIHRLHFARARIFRQFEDTALAPVAPCTLSPIRNFDPVAYLSHTRKIEFLPCIPTRGTEVPAGPDWLHEIKHDGYRLIVQREGKRVRLFTRNGYDCSDRYPLITEAAPRNRNTSFVIDGEAVLLGVDGRSDFDGLHSRKHDEEVQFYAFDRLVSDGEDIRKLPLSMRARPASPGSWRGASTA